MPLISDPILEICVDCYESIKNATEGGANRLELCSALSEDGLTPSFGLAKLAMEVSSVPVFAMIRIRSGDFVYMSQEIDSMVEDVLELKKLGIAGFVFGALDDQNNIDASACKKIIEAANPRPVTFHRAFDQVANPLAALEQIRQLGFKRILTSGQKRSALEGTRLLAELVEKAADDIIIVPGAGINEHNIGQIRDETAAREFHGSAKKSTNCPKGITITDKDTVQRMVKILNK
ncbi:copper homeostasis protein cutC homolog [Trichogramma pretiosum]|uniref:copper homeostasis protein cutC homolog n=1 Tax=Trichogramma pretiosum TaxID=7493 RepID=UPI000C71B763|nr:copper homeostasis protein cutC homolog [Trichogramma pretiosum]